MKVKKKSMRRIPLEEVIERYRKNDKEEQVGFLELITTTHPYKTTTGRNQTILQLLAQTMEAQVENSHKRWRGEPYEEKFIGRIQAAAPAGFGKTTSVKTLIQWIDQEELPYSVVVSLERIDEIDKVYDELLALGVNEDKIAKVHSRVDGLDYEGLKKFQFLLITQAKLKSAQYIDTFYTYGLPGAERLRDLMVWDESLISALTYNATKKETLHHLDKALRQEIPGDVRGFLVYFRGLCEKLKVKNPVKLEIDTHLLNSVSIPMIDKLPVEEEVKGLLRIFAGQDKNYWVRAAKRTSGSKENGSSVILSFREIIPRELDNIMVLDASASFREATLMDGSFEFWDLKPEVDYSGSSIDLWKYNSGGTDIKQAYGKKGGKRNEKRDIGWNEYQEFLNHTAEGILREDPAAKILVITYKDVEDPAIRRLQDHLFGKGLMSGGCLIRSLTYGKETGTNEFKDFGYVIVVGTFNKADYVIENLIASQLGDDDYDEKSLAFYRKQVEHTEMAHHFYQAVMRAMWRVLFGNEAKPTKVYGFTWSPGILMDILAPVLPGAQWNIYEAVEHPVFKAAWVDRRAKDVAKVSAVEDRIQNVYLPLLRRAKKPLSVKEMSKRLPEISLTTIKRDTKDLRLVEGVQRTKVRKSHLFSMSS